MLAFGSGSPFNITTPETGAIRKPLLLQPATTIEMAILAVSRESFVEVFIDQPRLKRIEAERLTSEGWYSAHISDALVPSSMEFFPQLIIDGNR
jgi:hypothetical protein